MTKIKTKKLLILSLSLVAIIAVAAFFYCWTNREEPEPIKKVPIADSIGAEDNQEESEFQVPREYISEYYEEKDRFNAIGVSWEEIDAGEGDISFYIRIKDNGEESQWLEVYKDLVKSEGDRNFYSAETPVLARGDEYQYKVTLAGPKNQVENIKFDIINTMGTAYLRFINKITLFFGSNVVSAAWDPANIISRDQWGGATDVNAISEELWPPEYAQKSTKFIVHHTPGVYESCKTYTQTEAEADVKALWSYFTYTKQWTDSEGVTHSGFGDMGYNYLVDTCGRVFEGRMGGDDVIAGHAAPYNYWDKVDGDNIIDEVSVGISLMGKYDKVSPTSPMFENTSRIIGYKSYINNIDPLGYGQFSDRTSSRWTGGALYNIAGHIDYTATTCPGEELYGRLPSVRSGANAHLALYVDAYGPYIEDSENIYINAFRISMDDLDDGLMLASNPAVGEPITATVALKNIGDQPISLNNVRVRGRYDNGVEFTVGTQSSLNINGGQITVLNLDSNSFGISSSRQISFYIDYEIEGQVKRPNYFDGFSYPSYTPHFPNVKVSLVPISNPTNPIINQSAQLSYTLKNLDSRPAYLKNSYINIVQDPININTTYKTSIIMLPDGTNSYVGSNTFNSVGNFQLRPYFTYGNGGITNPLSVSGQVVSETIAVLGEPVDYSKIAQNTLRITIGDYSTEDPNDYLYQFSSPAIGETITLVGALRNDNTSPATINNVRFIGVYDNGVKFVAGTISSLTIPANSVSVLPTKSFRLTSFRTVYFYIDFEVDGEILKPYIGPTYSPMKIKAHFPNVKVVSTPAFSPSSTTVNAPLTGIFKIKNFDSRPAYLKEIRLRTCTSGLCWSFPNIVRELVPGEVYKYVQPSTPTVGGTYTATVRIIYGNGSLRVPGTVTGINNFGSYKVYAEVATLEGIPIPATSGNVSVEQHLVTNSLTSAQIIALDTSFRSCVSSASEVYPYPTCSVLAALGPITEVTHYANTSLINSALKNRMAWMTTAKLRQLAGTTPWISAGGLYGAWGVAPSVANERYYITMRWNYESPIGSGTGANGQPVYADKSWYYGKRVVVTNPINGKKVVAAIIEYGPGIMTRVSGLSPEAMSALGISGINDNKPLNYYWAAYQSMPLGPIN